MSQKDEIAAVLSEFGADAGYASSPIGNGLIHETLVISYDRVPRYVLQHLNTDVFPDPALLANNARVVTDRIRLAVTERGGDISREVLRFVPARDGRFFTEGPDGSFWRLSYFIPGTITVDVPESVTEAGAVARAFAMFQHDVWDVPPERVEDAIPGFHDTPRRYRKLCQVVENVSSAALLERLDKALELVDEVHARQNLLGIIESERVAGWISTHVCHNDTKVNNVLLDESTRRPLCVIDFDTVGRGSPLMDVGDLLRTAAVTVNEEEKNAEKVAVDLDNARAIVDAFAEVLGERLNDRERQLLAFSGWVITVEQAIRYLTDYIEGDVYYGERYPEHNLFRTRNQLALVRSMEERLVDLSAIE